MRKRQIPIHTLKEYTDIGFILTHQDDLINEELKKVEMHRDEYYVLIVAEKSITSITVDFTEYPIKDCSIFYSTPGQIQSNIPKSSSWKGWGLAIEPNLVNTLCRKILLDNQAAQRNIIISTEQLHTLTHLLTSIKQEVNSAPQNPLNNRIVGSLLDVFISMFSRIYQDSQAESINTNTRPYLLTSAFKELVSQNFKTIKSPSQYAKKLNISSSYLNEVVKSTTGYSAGYWIIQENILEAKRLLYFSNLSIKEISFELGYEDYSYFSRLFSKSVAESPLQFRKRYRE